MKTIVTIPRRMEGAEAVRLAQDFERLSRVNVTEFAIYDHQTTFTMIKRRHWLFRLRRRLAIFMGQF